MRRRDWKRIGDCRTLPRHMPMIFVMLFGLALASTLLAGYAMAGSQSRPWLHMLGFAAVMALKGCPWGRLFRSRAAHSQ